MKSLFEIEARLDELVTAGGAGSDADELLRLGEDVLRHWVLAKGLEPTEAEREGFRLLALQRQGAQDDPSFNACRETCRELAYHYNLLAAPADDGAARQSQINMMALVANHLCLFVSGKMQVAGLGEFCCSSKPIREGGNQIPEVGNA